jgi:uncharacterized membrane protein YbaN (DUF454 family)
VQKIKRSGKLTKWLLIVVGTFLVGLGIIGIFLPLVPTTPTLLLAAACYARSSERFYNWLIGNQLFGKYIRDYRAGKGVPLPVKILTIFLLWLTIVLSIIFIVKILFIRIILFALAGGITIHIALIRPAKNGDK